MGTAGAMFDLQDRGDWNMNVKKLALVAALLVVAAFLAWLVWIETKVLVITLALLALCLGAIYVVVRKM